MMAKLPNLLFTTCIILNIFAIKCYSSQSVSAKLLKDILDNYDKRFRPNSGGPPTEVAISMYITNIEIKDSLTPGIILEMNFYWRHIWVDQRLQFDFRSTGVKEIQIGKEMVNNLWIPDTFCATAKDGKLHDLTVPNSHLSIRPDGEIFYSARYTAQVKCPADLYYFPFDKHLCKLEIESYGYTTDDVIYRWIQGPSSLGLSATISPVLFQVLSYKAVTQTKMMTNGNFTHLVAEILVQRTGVTYYFYRVFLPLGLLVFLSWTALWINWTGYCHVNGNGNGIGVQMNILPMIITAICFVAVVVTSMVIHIILAPTVNYCTTLDVYIIGCIFFSFLNFFVTILSGYWKSWFTPKDDSDPKDDKSENNINGMPRIMYSVLRISVLVFYLICLLVYCITAGD